MAIKLACAEYGFECDFYVEGQESITLIKKLKEHMEKEHGIEYSVDAVIQMVVNKGYSRDSIRNE